MAKYSCTVEELKRIIKESQQEFNPKRGSNVETDNQRNSDKFYKETENAIKAYNKGMNPPDASGEDRIDWNKTTVDYNPINKPSKEYTDRVKSQMRGYTSSAEEKNGNERVGDFDGNKKISKSFTDSYEMKNDAKKNLQKSGLVARNLPDEVFDKNKLFESKYKPKKLKFKRTVFLNESQVLKRIPEEYKRDGQIIYMRDSKDNLYIVECAYSPKSKIMETNIIDYRNATEDAKSLVRMGELMTYKSDTAGVKTPSERINESTAFKQIMNTVRHK